MSPTLALNLTRPMIDRPLYRPFWRVVDHLDYLVTLSKLRILDAVCGPLPETSADQQQARDRERLKKAFPKIRP